MTETPNPEPKWVAELYRAVTGRPRPEDVAKIVLRHFIWPAHRLKWWKRANGNSYMPTEFSHPMPLTRSANVLAMLIGERPLADEETFGPEMTALLAKGRKAIAAEEELDFKITRLNRASRKFAQVEMSNRRYNRLFRLIDFLEREREGNVRYGEFCELMRGAKMGILPHLSREEFARDQTTAFFVAYMGSRLAMRSKFTVDPQERAFDDLGDALLKDLEGSETTNWYAVAHVFPRTDVLARLSEFQRLTLLALALDRMRLAATVLERLAGTGIDIRKGCVVQRGQDSSGWNASAGAWNKARDFWMGLSSSLGLSVEAMLPGKVPRLMAADVAAWHRSEGHPPHPDEAIAAELPLPWNVFLHGAACTGNDIRAACAQHEVDPEKTGWTAPRPRQVVEIWHPTPELVHGVVVDHPAIAAAMRRLGYFAGPAKWERENYG
jgi:hypothetical protein